MNRNFNLPGLTETQKNALFAFGEKTKAGTGCNLMIAASMCEGDLTKAILMNLADLVETVGITDEEMAIHLRPYRIAKEEGCKFYLGSDAHALRAFEGMKENFQKITDLLELDDRHKFVPQP